LLESVRCAQLISPARCLGTLCWLLLVGSASAASLGVMGDSLSDEYAETSYGSYAENWLEQLGDYADYVRNYAFPPPVPALSAPGLALLCALMLASALAALPRT
jgi:hypothetical protein